MSSSKWMAAAYLASALPAASFLAAALPPFQVPDETAHYLYARAITHGSLLPKPVAGGAGGTVSAVDLQLIQAFAGLPFHAEVKASREMFETARALADSGHTVDGVYTGAANYPPTAYLVPAIGLVIADAAGADRLHAFYAGRMANAVFVITAVALSMAMTPVGGAALAFVFLLPMSLSQSASFSVDAFVFALTPLICSILARESSREGERPSTKWLLLAAILLVAVVPAKAPLIALVVPFFCVAQRRSRRLAVGVSGAVLVLSVLWTVAFVLSDAQTARMQRVGQYSVTGQLEYVISSPLQAVGVGGRTLKDLGATYLDGMVGVLGWLDTRASPWYYKLALASLLLSYALAVLEPRGLSSRVAAAFAACSLLMVLLTLAALYLGWSRIGSPVVTGVQGRYFIPALVPLVFAVSGRLREYSVPRGNLMAAAFTFAFGAVSIFHWTHVLISRFYLK